ncbi:MAG: sel1 repeat family protein [Rhodobacteraceae bacterium]|nr:sel1 repeat family protein [Paracoccaceae bacterium]
MYDIGEGVLADATEAVRWFRLAADQGNASAQFNLGLMYGNGEGVLADHISAHMWFNIAGGNGDEEARKSRERVEAKMALAEISEAVNSARACISSDCQNCR